MALLSQCPTAATVVGHCQQPIKQKDEERTYS